MFASVPAPTPNHKLIGTRIVLLWYGTSFLRKAHAFSVNGCERRGDARGHHQARA